MDKAYQRLRQYKVQHTSTAPQRLPDWNKAAAGIRAFYFKDPDGHNLKLTFHRKTIQNGSALLINYFRIDHTAIVVANTEASLKFYRDLLGLKLAGESENYGTEQEHLNNGARLQISSLRAPRDPELSFSNI